MITYTDTRLSDTKLAALDPYLALLPEGEKTKIKTELATKLFDQPPFMRGKESKGKGLTEDTLQMILKAITKGG